MSKSMTDIKISDINIKMSDIDIKIHDTVPDHQSKNLGKLSRSFQLNGQALKDLQNFF